MKQIDLKTTQEIGRDGNAITLRTADLIAIAVNNAPAGGYNVSQMMDRLKILSKIEKLPEEAVELSLEDAEYTNLGVWVKDVKWGILSQFIVDFVQSF